jgi:aryl-alcohol dehydrogenase-like predicted oxidoreductase
LAKEVGIRPEDLAQAFVNSRPFLGANIIGATSMEQLKIAIASIDIVMTPELEAKINAIHHTYCNPCP